MIHILFKQNNQTPFEIAKRANSIKVLQIVKFTARTEHFVLKSKLNIVIVAQTKRNRKCIVNNLRFSIETAKLFFLFSHRFTLKHRHRFEACREQFHLFRIQFFFISFAQAKHLN